MSNWKPGDSDRRKIDALGEQKKKIIADAAELAMKVVEEAAQKALTTLGNAAATVNATVNLDIAYIKTDITAIKLLLESKYVTKEAFGPVKTICYAIAGTALAGVLGAVVSLVIIRR